MLSGYGTCLLRVHTTPRGATIADSACIHHTGSARWRYCFRTSAPKYIYICIFHRRPLKRFLHFLLILMRTVIDNFTAYLPSIHRRSVKIRELLIPQAPTNIFQTFHPSISAWTTHGLPLITSPSKRTTVLIRRNAPTDSCHNLKFLCHTAQKHNFYTHYIHYIICAHRNSDNLHNAVFIGYSLVLLWSYINYETGNRIMLALTLFWGDSRGYLLPERVGCLLPSYGDWINICISKPGVVHMHVSTHTLSHAHMHARAHTHTHARTHAHTHNA